MSINPPVLPPSWGPAPNGRSAHALLEPLYAWADVTDERLTDLESQGGTSVTDNGNGTATLTGA